MIYMGVPKKCGKQEKELNPKQSFSLELRAEYASGIYHRQGISQKTLSFNIIAGIDFR